MKRIIIQGSSRSTGNTNKIVKLLMEELEFDFLDLKIKNIGHFDYEFENKNDDFLSIITQIVNEYDLIIFASPVYWYSMSGMLKVFFDRISDCLYVEKEIGRKLRNKNMAVICCGSDENIIETFFIPFKKSAEYLGMNYLGNVHTWVEGNSINNSVKERIAEFAKLL